MGQYSLLISREYVVQQTITIIKEKDAVSTKYHTVTLGHKVKIPFLCEFHRITALNLQIKQAKKLLF